MKVEDVDERIQACVRAKQEHNSPVSDLLAQERIDELLDLRKQLEDLAEPCAES